MPKLLERISASTCEQRDGIDYSLLRPCEQGRIRRFFVLQRTIGDLCLNVSSHGISIPPQGSLVGRLLPFTKGVGSSKRVGSPKVGVAKGGASYPLTNQVFGTPLLQKTQSEVALSSIYRTKVSLDVRY